MRRGSARGAFARAAIEPRASPVPAPLSRAIEMISRKTRSSAALGQTAPSSFVTAAAGLAPIADVPGGDSDPPITPPVRPVSSDSGSAGDRTVGSAAPASPCHIAPWMRLPAGPALLRASSALRRALSGHCIASREAGEGAGVCMGVGRTQFLQLGGSNPLAAASQFGLCAAVSACVRTVGISAG